MLLGRWHQDAVKRLLTLSLTRFLLLDRISNLIALSVLIVHCARARHKSNLRVTEHATGHVMIAISCPSKCGPAWTDTIVAGHLVNKKGASSVTHFGLGVLLHFSCAQQFGPAVSNSRTFSLCAGVEESALSFQIVSINGLVH